MKQVTATMLTHDATIGRVEPGQVYTLEDDKAARWIAAGIATDEPPAPPLPPEPEPDEEEEAEAGESEDEPSPDVAEEARKLHAEGLSERAIAQQLGISRPKVHSLLMG